MTKPDAEPVRWHPDPATRMVMAAVAAANPPRMTSLTPAEARLAMREAGKTGDMAPPPLARVEDFTVPGPGGPLRVRLYDPRPAAEAAGEAGQPARRGLPVCLYFHGGGFVIGDLDTHDSICRSLSLAAGVMVLAVDYRLAPEHRYPAAVEDALAAWSWLSENATTFGGDPTRLAVAGDSAGGTLAAVVAQEARDAGSTALKAQVLFYPVVDIGGSYASRDEQAETMPIPRDVLQWFWTHYFGPGADEASTLHPWASPIRAKSLSGLPPTWVMTAGLDPLRDEGMAYARRVAATGVETHMHTVMGTIHGYLRMGRLMHAPHDALAAAGAFLGRRLAGGSTIADRAGQS